MANTESHIGHWIAGDGLQSGAPQSYSDFKSSFTQFDADVYDIAEELAELLVRKHNDYGPGNINGSPYGAIPGLITRMWDKMARIKNLTENDKQASNEPLEDSFMDLANYAIIGLMVTRGKWPK